jgi:hypothetical protein
MVRLGKYLDEINIHPLDQPREFDKRVIGKCNILPPEGDRNEK